MLDGDHDLQTSAKITQEAISAVYRELIIQNVLLEGRWVLSCSFRTRILFFFLFFFSQTTF